VADLVLLNDSFMALPHGFREGQRILNGMQDILKLYLTRVIYMGLLILSVGLISTGFPIGPGHSAVLSLLTVGIPTLALAAWARPGASPRRGQMRSLLRLVLPAAVTLALAGLGVYLLYFLPASRLLRARPPGVEALVATHGPLSVAQSALTTLLVVCGLLLLAFVAPPMRAWLGGDGPRGDWRPSLLAVGLFVGYGVILAVAPLRELFDLVPLALSDYLLLGGVAMLWALVLRWTWRVRLLERVLGIDLVAGVDA
jgi:cation-transporting ATPase E